MQKLLDVAFLYSLVEFPQVEAVWLYGSRQSQPVRPEADIDLAIYCPTASPEQWSEILALLDQQRNFVPMDVVRLDSLDHGHPLRANIERQHVTLFQKDGPTPLGFERRLVQWAQTLSNLRRAIQAGNPDPYTERGCEHMEASVKRFELAWELCWKTLQKILDREGLPAAGPRPVMQNAFQLQLLPAPFLWQQMLESRNLAAHMYSPLDAMQLYELLPSYLQQFLALYELISRRYEIRGPLELAEGSGIGI
ncbi:MAG: HI0074 family nucleotidyltransferase substrate-binding subunit [Chlamydiia bacterium]